MKDFLVYYLKATVEYLLTKFLGATTFNYFSAECKSTLHLIVEYRIANSFEEVGGEVWSMKKKS